MGEGDNSAKSQDSAQAAGSGQEKDPRVKKTLKQSIVEGSFSATMVGLGESFYSAFAVFLQATSFQLSLLGSLPQLLGSLSQLLTAKLILLFGSRKRLLVTTVVLQALMLIPIMFVFLSAQFSVWLLILFACLYWFFGMISNPAWTSWMGDIVDPNERGSYFGRRNKITGIIMFIGVMGAGFALQYFKGNDLALTGFLIIFSIAMVARLLSALMLWRQYEPPYEPPQNDSEGFVEFLRGMRSTNYGLLVIFLSCMSFAVAISGPFFAAYWLNDLHLSYMTFTIIMGTSMVMKYVLQPMWGRVADKYGTHKVLTVTAIMMPLVPIMWLFSSNFWWMMWAQVYSGFVWAGFELASFNFLLDATEPKKRAKYLSYYNVINGSLVFIGALLGALLLKVDALTSIFWSSFFAVFLISGVLRGLVAIIFVFRLKEVRTVEHIGYKDLLFDVLQIQPNIGIRQTAVVIRENIVDPFEQGTRRIVDPLVKPIKPIMGPIVKPIETFQEEVLPSSVVKGAAELPEKVVSVTVRRLESAAKETPTRLVDDAAAFETEVAQGVNEGVAVVKRRVKRRVSTVRRGVKQIESVVKEKGEEAAKEFNKVTDEVERVVAKPLAKVKKVPKHVAKSVEVPISKVKTHVKRVVRIRKTKK